MSAKKKGPGAAALPKAKKKKKAKAKAKAKAKVPVPPMTMFNHLELFLVTWVYQSGNGCSTHHVAVVLAKTSASALESLELGDEWTTDIRVSRAGDPQCELKFVIAPQYEGEDTIKVRVPADDLKQLLIDYNLKKLRNDHGV